MLEFSSVFVTLTVSIIWPFIATIIIIIELGDFVDFIIDKIEK